MKPIKLVLSAYGPFLDKTEIDFEKLGSDGVFLISGPTGSGKTTIFDGICYALYGTASGNLRTPKMMRSTYAEPDVKTFVELTFLSHGKEYRISRRPEQEVNKVSGSGTTVRPSEVSLEILDGGSTVYTGKREVEEKIKAFSNKEAVSIVSTKQTYTIEGSGKHVAIMDFGIKSNIIRNFKKRKSFIVKEHF